jgi:hypothetical protein
MSDHPPFIKACAAFAVCFLWAGTMYTQLPLPQPAPDPCQEQIHHLTVQSPALLEDGLVGHTPLEYLFSEDGDDIYSATSFDVNQLGQYLHGNVTTGKLLGVSTLGGGDGMRFIVVYQDEKSRQQTIDNLRKPGVLSTSVLGNHAPLENLKFAVVHVQMDYGGPGSSVDKSKYLAWIDKKHTPKEEREYYLDTFKWSITDIAFFEPKACLNYPQESSFPAYDGMANWIGDLNTGYPNKKLEPYWDPQYVRTINVMVMKLRKFADQTQK